MKKLANIFMKVSKIIGIFGIVGMAIAIGAQTIVIIVSVVACLAESGGAVDVDGVVAIVGAGIGAIIGLSFGLACYIVSVALNVKATKGFAAAKTKDEAKKYAIMAIVSGVLGTEFAIASGILYLAMPERAFRADEVKTREDNKVEEEVVDAEIVEAEIVE